MNPKCPANVRSLNKFSVYSMQSAFSGDKYFQDYQTNIYKLVNSKWLDPL